MIPNFYLLVAKIKRKCFDNELTLEAIVRATNAESAWDTFDEFTNERGEEILERTHTITFPSGNDPKVFFYSYTPFKER